MDGIPYLPELTIIAVVGVAVTVLLSRFRLPTVAGLLAAGALLGPYGLGLANDVDTIEMLAEVGVVLLLFTIGLEYSLTRLKTLFKDVALGGALQVGLTTLAALGIAVALGKSVSEGLFYGFVFALSSTAIVLRGLAERQELDAPHGQFIVGTLIFQDLCVVPMVLIVPLIGGASGGGQGVVMDIGLAMLKAIVVVALTLALARWLVPKLLNAVESSGSREVFLLAIIGICIGTAWLTSMAGLSLALGAFLGGVIVADTEFKHRAMGDILPLRDVFVSLFFVSLGMLFNGSVVMERPGEVLGLFLAFTLGKGLIAALAAAVLRMPPRAAWLSGVGLAQFGEFGFVLTQLALSNNVVDSASTTPLLAAGIASMFVTPLLIRAAPNIRAGEKLFQPLHRMLGGPKDVDTAPIPEALSGHILILGYGLTGAFALKALHHANIRAIALGMNATTVRNAQAEGLPVHYGDATSEDTLLAARAPDARLVVIVINDRMAAQRIIDTLRRVAPHAQILTRSHYLYETSELLDLGANDVVAEEVEGAVEIVARILRAMEVPRNLIELEIRHFRDRTQTSDRVQTLPRVTLGNSNGLEDLKIDSVIVTERCQALDQSPTTLDLRATTGALVVGVRRNDVLLQAPEASTRFKAGDIVYLVGETEAIRRASQFFGTRIAGVV